MVTIAVGHAAIDKKSWTRESQRFTLEEQDLGIGQAYRARILVLVLTFGGGDVLYI